MSTITMFAMVPTEYFRRTRVGEIILEISIYIYGEVGVGDTYDNGDDVVDFSYGSRRPLYLSMEKCIMWSLLDL